MSRVQPAFFLSTETSHSSSAWPVSRPGKRSPKEQPGRSINSRPTLPLGGVEIGFVSNNTGNGKGENAMQFIRKAMEFARSEDGPTAVEYAVMLALIILVALGAITLLGQKVNTIFTNVESQLP